MNQIIIVTIYHTIYISSDMKSLSSLLFLLFITLLTSAQDDQSWKLFADDSLTRVEITINPDTLDWIYNHVDSDEEHLAKVLIVNKYFSVSYDSIGFRLRGGTSRLSAKKSFKISLNSFKKGTNLFGIEKINLNGEHNDPTLLRSKISFNLFQKASIKAARSNHTELYINNEYYGTYISVEQLDEEFLKRNFVDANGNLWKCLYPANLFYLGDNPDTYKNLNNGSNPVYELKTNEGTSDFTPMVTLIKTINTISIAQLGEKAEEIIHIDEPLKYFAMNLLLGQWDDYRGNNNNYYLYYTYSDRKFHVIPYDYDNTFGVDWANTDWSKADPYNYPSMISKPLPLSDRLLQVPEFRNLYTYFILFYNQRVFNPSLWSDELTKLESMITPSVEADQWRKLDYGFTMNDFHNGISATSYNNKHVKRSITEFADRRFNSIAGQCSFVSSGPIAWKWRASNRYPLSGDQVTVTTSAWSHNGILKVELEYKIGSGSVSSIEMPHINSQNLTNVDSVNFWKAQLPVITGGQEILWRIKLTDSLNASQYFPRNSWESIKCASISAGVKINELMASNASTIKDPSGQYDDWIELYNSTDSPILLSGCYLTDDYNNLTKWRFSGSSLAINPGEYIIVWADDDENQQGIHTNFKLSASGEELALVAPNGITIFDSVTFPTQSTDISWGRIPNATGAWRTLKPTPGNANTTVGIDPINDISNLSLSIYPNPATNEITLKYPDNLNQTVPTSLSIISLGGKVVFEQILSNSNRGSQLTLPIPDLSNGVYTILLQNNYQRGIYKLIITK